MNILLTIKGREAIPVRALPWATGWWFSTREICETLAYPEEASGFNSVAAYRLEDGVVHKVPTRDWERALQAIEELSALKLPRHRWEEEATKALPPGVFVWRDEWEEGYNQSPDGMDPLHGVTEEAGDFEERRLDFAPWVQSSMEALIGEGFEPGSTLPTPRTDASTVKVKAGPRIKADGMTPVIEAARREAGDRCNPSEVFGILKVWALRANPPPPPPMVGGLSRDGKAILWENSDGVTKSMDREALAKRITRR
jgi:hypothetical protein